MKKRALDLARGERITLPGLPVVIVATIPRRNKDGVRFTARASSGSAWVVTCDLDDTFEVLPKKNDGGGMSRAEGRRQRKEIGKQIAADLRAKARAKVRELRAALAIAKRERKASAASASATCAKARALLATRRKERRARLLAELREVSAQEIAAASARCGSRRAAGDRKVAEARKALDAERTFQRSIARIEAGNRARRSERAGAKGARASAERRAESDDEVRANLPPELVPLFDRVRARIKASTRQSRTEAFLTYAEEHPDEITDAQEAGADAVIRDLEKRMAEAETFARKRRYTAAELADVPF